MVRFPHEMLVELFRNSSELAPAMLQRYAGIELPHARSAHWSSDLSQVVPTEYRADAVSVLRDTWGNISAAVISEIQLRVDHDKERSWPLYVAALHAKLGCPVILLVLAPSNSVGRWARVPIPLGHPDFVLTPIVVELGELPAINDASDAKQLPELAVLSALANPQMEVATAAASAISGLPADQSQLYLDAILAALPSSRRKVFMQGYVYQSEFARKYYGKGHEEGREQGVEEGVRTAARAFLEAKLGKLAAKDRAALEAVPDEAALAALINALGRAKTAAAVRAALAAASAPQLPATHTTRAKRTPARKPKPRRRTRTA